MPEEPQAAKGLHAFSRARCVCTVKIAATFIRCSQAPNHEGSHCSNDLHLGPQEWTDAAAFINEEGSSRVRRFLEQPDQHPERLLVEHAAQLLSIGLPFRYQWESSALADLINTWQPVDMNGVLDE